VTREIGVFVRFSCAGLGLAIAKKILDLHDSSLELISSETKEALLF
jgi:nitrogen fixation/metabolism regulation signal transduction histidine kinase